MGLHCTERFVKLDSRLLEELFVDAQLRKIGDCSAVVDLNAADLLEFFLQLRESLIGTGSKAHMDGVSPSYGFRRNKIMKMHIVKFVMH